MEPSAKRQCPECGAENEGAAFYCRRCRAFLRGRPAAAKPAQTQEQEPAPRPNGGGRLGGGFSPFDLGGARPRSADTAPPPPTPAKKEEKQEPAPPPPAKKETPAPAKTAARRFFAICPDCDRKVTWQPEEPKPEFCPFCSQMSIFFAPQQEEAADPEPEKKQESTPPPAPDKWEEEERRKKERAAAALAALTGQSGEDPAQAKTREGEPAARPGRRPRRPLPPNKTVLRLYPLDERETEVFTVDADAAILGREGTVRAEFFTQKRFPYMSGRHAQLRRAPTGWYIKDTSRNGTSLNGTPMQGREMMLKDGDFLTLYDYELRVSIL